MIERWIKKDGRELPSIFVRAKLNGEHWLDYKIWEITGIVDGDKPFIGSQDNGMDPANLETDDDCLLTGFIKWDGCAQFYMQNEPAYHSDDRESALILWNLVIDSIYDLGKELIPAWSEF